MKEAKGSNGNQVGSPDTKGKAGAKVSNRAGGVKAAGSHILGRMNPDAKYSCGKMSGKMEKGKC